VSPRSWKLRIDDILESIADIEIFTKGMTQDRFEKDKKTYLAVVRSLEVIGEASHHVPESIKAKYPKVPWRKMKDFRNILIHEY